MKKIEINGKTYEYTTFGGFDEYGEWYWTEFYDGVKQRYKRTGFLGLFGSKVLIEEPNLVFTIDADSNDSRLTKEWWRTRIEREVELLDRQSQLEKGELI